MSEFLPILPEALLAVTLILVLLAEATYHGEQVRLTTASALVGLFAVFVQTILTYQFGSVQIFSNTVSIDGLALYFKVLFVILAALAVVASSHSAEIAPRERTEYFGLILASCLGMFIAASSAHLLLAFLALQLVNLMGVYLAGYSKGSSASTEAAVKHMAFSALSAGLMLYGIALLFANTGTLNVYEIHKAVVATPGSSETLLVVFTLIFLSLCFQIAAFPFHLWAPDVLEGAPTPASGFVAVGSRAAGFAVALRFFIVVFAQPHADSAPGVWQSIAGLNWTLIVALVSGISMLAGGLLAFRQVSAKRLVGCLVVAQSGFLLTGILVLDQVGVAALLYNLAVELFALTGIFYVLGFLKDELKSDELENLKGMLKRAVPECICLILFLLCLIGLPPTPGFIGKFALIGALVRHQWLGLAILALISLVLGVLGVARLSFAMIGNSSSPTGAGVAPLHFQRKVFLAVLTLPIVLTAVFADQVFRWAGGSLGFILW